jgi:hypothetical protein
MITSVTNFGCDTGLFDGPFHSRCAELCSGNFGKASAETSDGCAHCGYDDDFTGHGFAIGYWVEKTGAKVGSLYRSTRY